MPPTLATASQLPPYTNLLLAENCELQFDPTEGILRLNAGTTPCSIWATQDQPEHLYGCAGNYHRLRANVSGWQEPQRSWEGKPVLLAPPGQNNSELMACVSRSAAAEALRDKRMDAALYNAAAVGLVGMAGIPAARALGSCLYQGSLCLQTTISTHYRGQTTGPEHDVSAERERLSLSTSNDDSNALLPSATPPIFDPMYPEVIYLMVGAAVGFNFGLIIYAAAGSLLDEQGSAAAGLVFAPSVTIALGIIIGFGLHKRNRAKVQESLNAPASAIELGSLCPSDAGDEMSTSDADDSPVVHR